MNTFDEKNEFHFFSNSCYDKANRDDTGIKTGGPASRLLTKVMEE